MGTPAVRIHEILPLLESATVSLRSSDTRSASVCLSRAATLLQTRPLDTTDRLLLRQPMGRLRTVLTGFACPPADLVTAVQAIACRVTE